MQSPQPFRVVRSNEFSAWLAQLRDDRAQVAIERRIGRLRRGNFGDAHSVGSGVSELRFDIGPGYRLYFVRVHNVIIVLLCGGDKSSQTRDIARAKEIAKRAQEIADGRKT